ncbi:hypothetical protein K461DRAFT_320591 [Myriangium duriaei CBS 260.36]|uniref:Heme haloperoxidase family profile domain-containing protein n=1 Tax=Myriangium duriaei CBS 260.36 TaxID=1168546 RepID=A0A9P4MIN6_9PEZI|nr:hypothetical protein K461DRAFT_320591 [Myriangium duriaei CBS 260.36]
MLFSSISLLAVASVVAAAGRPANTTICDFYTTALFKDNNSTNQRGLVAAVVNRAAAGNTTANPMLTGILAPGTFNGAPVDITPWFTGALNSSNTGGGAGFSLSFVDGGGLAALQAGMPATDPASNQFTLFTHLYAYFGSVLGCSKYSTPGYPPYVGKPSMFEVHKFMGLNENMIGYFNEQVGLSAASFGVTSDDVTAIGNLLNTNFNVRCAPKTTIIKAQGAQLQAFCLASSCKIAEKGSNSTCKSYPAEPKPSSKVPQKSAAGCSSSAAAATTTTTSSMAAKNTGSSTTTTSTTAAAATAAPDTLGTTTGESSSSPTTAGPDSLPSSTTSSAANGTLPIPARQTTNAGANIHVGYLLPAIAFALTL